MKKTTTLCGAWEMRPAGETAWMPAQVPGSVYNDLMQNGRMKDPYWRDNEDWAFHLMENDYEYRRSFTLGADMLCADALILRFEGVDTLAYVSVNGVGLNPPYSCFNMHRTWDFVLDGIAREGENLLEITFFSPLRFMREMDEKLPLGGTTDCTRGFPHLRKAHCMSGWDWGPRLPDAGLWRNVSLISVDRAELKTVKIGQTHLDGGVTLSFEPEIDHLDRCAACEKGYGIRYTVTAPNKSEQTVSCEADGEYPELCSLRIECPALWWPNGYGEQPLYTVRAELIKDGCVRDVWERRIGLRTLTVRREKDAWGESFETCVNGVSIFGMGADYIPEDNLLSRTSPERTRRLLSDCRLANYNTVRVWGGGHYPSDAFYDICDEMGLLVWQDLMFACALYRLTDDFYANIEAEFEDNIRRIRHHASLAILCGNNENEWIGKEYGLSPQLMVDYVRMFEDLAPSVVRELSPQTFYWPSSPSSGITGGDSNDPNRGDVHYWEVWHGGKPFIEYRKHFFRYASEFGFQSFPCKKTVESFTLPEDRNIFSYVMERHQRNNAANGKIMNYMAATYLYPTSFDTLLYASQLLQAEAIRCGVEHWRRNRGRCMGAIYWQINDCWPVASWSSIDYFGRWKALHYAAKRFFAPVLLSCCEEGAIGSESNVNAQPHPIQISARLNLSNETRRDADALVRWALRKNDGSVLQCGEETARVPALSALWLSEHLFPDACVHDTYFSYELFVGGETVSQGTALFAAPKHFAFLDPGLTVSVRGDTVTVSARAYARSVEIVCEDGDALFSDNYFDLNADSRTVKILRGGGTRFSVRSVYDIR